MTTSRKAKTEQPEGEERKPVVMLSPDRMAHRETAHNDYVLMAPNGTMAADIHRHPTSAALLAYKLSVGDRLTIITMDGKTLFECLCVRGDRMGATPLLHVLNTIQLPAPSALEEGIPDGYTVRAAGVGDEQRGWLCVRTHDLKTGEALEPPLVMNYGQPLFSHAEAVKWLLEHPAVANGVAAPKQLP